MKREQERWMEDGGDGNHAELFYTPGKTGNNDLLM